jgi:hypothetical protein
MRCHARATYIGLSMVTYVSWLRTFPDYVRFLITYVFKKHMQPGNVRNQDKISKTSPKLKKRKARLNQIPSRPRPPAKKKISDKFFFVNL